jgi:hypothetical protein
MLEFSYGLEGWWREAEQLSVQMVETRERSVRIMHLH